jgi:Spy/CpxP family protein refolding chaperone
VNYWKVILATMVIFGAGVITGGLLVHHVSPGWGRRPARAGARPAQLSAAGLMRLELLRRMAQELDLTPEQREPANQVIKEGQDRMKKLMVDTIEPRRREVYRQTIEEFRALLTPQQRKRFDALLKKQQQRARDQRKATSPRQRPQPKPALTNSQPAQPATL